MIDHLVDRAGLDSWFERSGLDGPLAQREVVREHPDLPTHELLEGGVPRAWTCRHHAVLDEKERPLPAHLRELARQGVELAHIARFPWALRLDQDVSAHFQPPFPRYLCGFRAKTFTPFTPYLRA